VLALACAVAACGTAATVELHDAETLLAERDEWRGARDGAVYLRRSVHAVVGAAPDPRAATSRLILHTTLARYGGAEETERLRFLAPAGASVKVLDARILDDAGERPVRASALGPREGGLGIDPGQVVWEAAFPGLSAGAILEVIVEATVRGTLATDARWLSAETAPTAELLLRYDLPSHGAGAFSVVGAERRALTTESDGLRITALLLRDLPAREGADAPYARFVTTRLNPRNYAQPMAESWREATSDYLAGLVAPSRGLREGYRAPFVPSTAGRQAALDAYHWVRDRLQRDDALAAPWHAARPLVRPIADNDLTGTDKVHTLAWLLEEAGVAFAFAVARRNTWPDLDPALPAPSVFDVALIHLPEHGLWLDPACRSCEAGEVRPDLRGGWALSLSAGATPERLP